MGESTRFGKKISGLCFSACLITFLTFAFNVNAIAQVSEKTITGKVIDEIGVGIIRATVAVKGEGKSFETELKQ